ncbi:ABC transporter permease [Roseivirga sp.]|uniref:ABC transporter permease n=1 Tax=Roseivirga sp. TaxID=1964215 RepID=UPI003B8B1489
MAEKLLLWFLKEDLAEEVLGDLDEKYYSQLDKHHSTTKAKRNYWYQVFNYMRPFAFKFFRSELFNNTSMIKHNFKISYRQMLRNKAYSFINIAGLAMGLVVAILIGLWVEDEVTFNKYHSNYENTYHLLRHENEDGEWYTNNALVTGMGAFISTKYPDMVEHSVISRARTQNRVISHGENKFRQIGLFMQESAPSMLGLEMVRGTHEGLNDITSILLSESFAKRLFGDKDPMNQLVELDAEDNLLVTGVYKDIPNNSKFTNGKYLVRIEMAIGAENMNIWNNQNIDIFLQLKPEVNPNTLSKLINEAFKPNISEGARESDMVYFLHPMKDWHLNSEWKNGEPVTSKAMRFVWLYSIIGLFVLILACINFMNLSTARSEKRAKEVGIRKTLGSLRKQLIAQFYIESFLYSILAFALSIILLYALLPWFNGVSGKEISAPWQSTRFWLLTSGFVLLTSLLSGSYPAFYLSSFKPIKALKGALSGGKRASIPRKILVVFQFTISIALIIGTITVNNQIQTAQDRPVGYSPKGMLAINPASPNVMPKRDLIKDELLKTGMAVAVGSSNYPVTSTLGWNPGFSWEGMNPNFNRAFNTISISHGYGDAVGLKFIAGRDFSEALETDNRGIIINRSAMEAMELENPIGTVVTYNPRWREPRNYTIIGVVEDMIKGSPFDETSLSIMFLDEGYMQWLYIRLNPEVSASQSIPALEKVYNKVFPEAPFDYTFADSDYNVKFEEEQRISSLAQFFSILAIFISSLGLFGLASFIAEQRTKEIGIRKVLGASILTLWKLLSKDFALLVMLASIISIPISYYVLEGWLAGYAVQTKLHWWIFAIGAFGGLFITIMTVSFQAIKAAVANPVKSLRSE